MLVNDKSTTIRAFQAGDGPAIAEAWTRAMPKDGITYDRFRDLILLDRNFDAAGLFIAESDGRLIGAAYGVRRLIATVGSDLESDTGWLPFFFVVPEARGVGLGKGLVSAVMDWLQCCGAQTVVFSAYSPNYFYPGLDTDRYPAAARLLQSLGFTVTDEAFAMDRSLNDYVMPEDVRHHIDELAARGWKFGSPNGDDLVDLVRIAGRFNWDWARVLRESSVAGAPLDRIICVRDPNGQMLGWAAVGVFDGVIDRFGPFGVLPESRGTGLGECILHLTLERMRSLGSHGAWFLWVEDGSPAYFLYRKAGFTVTRGFSIFHASLNVPNGSSER